MMPEKVHVWIDLTVNQEVVWCLLTTAVSSDDI